MNILLLTRAGESSHPMGRYLGLHCTYDFNNWIEGFSNLPYGFHSYDFYKSFVEDGPLVAERKILDLVHEHSIDLVVVPNMYYQVNVSFLRTLRSTGIQTLIVFFDDSTRFEDTNRYFLGHCDHIVTHESRRAVALYRSYGVIADFFPCFPSLAFYDRISAESSRSTLDLGEVSFVGANIADRSVFLEALSEAGLRVSVYGSGWPNGPVSQRSMLQIYRDSKISLNFTKNISPGGGKQLKARAFEIVLAGGFLLTEYDEELFSYFEAGREIDSFTSQDECVKKARYYLENPQIRESMRQRAIEKCRSEFNFETAWERYLQRLAKGNDSAETIPVLRALPTEAIRSFLRWNFRYFVARIRTGGIRQAIDQMRWCLRDLQFLSVDNAKKSSILTKNVS
jgi:hypothetical protein